MEYFYPLRILKTPFRACKTAWNGFEVCVMPDEFKFIFYINQSQSSASGFVS